LSVFDSCRRRSIGVFSFFPMSSALKILAYFLGTLVLGAILAPPLFWGGQGLGERVKSLAWLGDTDFQRYFNRAMFLAALALLWPTVRSLRVGSWREWGWRRHPREGWHAAGGFALAGGLLWMLGLWLWHTGVYAPNPKGPPGVGTLVNFLLTAAVVSALEEAFFRGALLGLLLRTIRPIPALWFVSALFAVLHFLKPEPGGVPDEAVRWWSGFALLPSVFWQWGNWPLVLGGFFTLLLVGLILGYARLRTGSLGMAFGLHAGWIFALKSFSRASKHIADPNLWYGENLLTGLGTLLTLLVTGSLVWAWLKAERMKDEG
jgi:membrane protease YdiL (CAAX protease family)